MYSILDQKCLIFIPDEMIYLMSKTWEVFAQSSTPEARVKNARQTKKAKYMHYTQVGISTICYVCQSETKVKPVLL